MILIFTRTERRTLLSDHEHPLLVLVYRILEVLIKMPITLESSKPSDLSVVIDATVLSTMPYIIIIFPISLLIVIIELIYLPSIFHPYHVVIALGMGGCDNADRKLNRQAWERD